MTLSRYEQIYQDDAPAYDQLVAAEDARGALRGALGRHFDAAPARSAFELGVGTGRVTRWLLAAGFSVTGFERFAPMLAVAHARLSAEGYDARGLALGDAYDPALRAPRGCGLAVAGWVFGHALSWHPDDWQARLDVALGTLDAALAPGGTTLVIETLGTAVEAPSVAPRLAPYYARLEDLGFVRETLATPYRFDSVDEAATRMGFFFGDATAARVREAGWAEVPEFTGLWARARRGDGGAP